MAEVMDKSASADFIPSISASGFFMDLVLAFLASTKQKSTVTTTE